MCCDSWGRNELDTTEQLNLTERHVKSDEIHLGSFSAISSACFQGTTWLL